MARLKPDAEVIKQFLNDLGQKEWVKRSERHWWPRFVFHYSDIRNAIKILQDGHLRCRKYLEDHDALPVSSGSPTVLAGTNTAVKGCVRLYFRPKTPTQFHVEGIRSQSVLSVSRFRDAHCPVPVFFLFDSADVLARADSWFSDGNLGSTRARILSSAAQLEQLPWRRIYHTGAFDPASPEDSDIVFRRCAEIIVPQKLPLKALRFIYCRSEAEKETLLHQLPPKLRRQYQSKIVASARSDLFYRQHTFVEAVRLSSHGALVQFSPETKSPGPFDLRIDLPTTSPQTPREVHRFSLATRHAWKIQLQATSYTIALYLDGNLAYANEYNEIEVPF